nr:unnamed protein product [Callosobruchus chinensis]
MPKRKRSCSPSGDNATILRLLNKLGKRLDALEKRRQKRPRHCSPNSGDSSSSSDAYTQRSRRNRREHLTSDESSDECTSEGLQTDSQAFISFPVFLFSEEEVTCIAEQGQENSGIDPSGDATVVTAPTLNADILSVLGDETGVTKVYGPPIHKHIADRWLQILKSGLDGEKRKELISKYPAPDNSRYFEAPKLNAIVRQAINDSVVKRDERLTYKQTQIGVALSAIGSVISELLEKQEAGGDNKSIIERLSDAGRLLSDLHRSESTTRRDLASLNLNKEWRDTLSQSITVFGSTEVDKTGPRKFFKPEESTQEVSGNISEWTLSLSNPLHQHQISPAKSPTPPREIHLRKEVSPEVKVGKSAGRLKYFYHHWKDLTNNKQILSWLEGVKFPFIKSPSQAFAPKEPNWSLKEQELISHSIGKMLKSGAISKVRPYKGQFLSKYFLIPKKDGTSRFILNLKNLNQYIATSHFKLEDHRVVARLIERNCCMAKIDLQEAYFSVPVYKKHRKYLRFSFNSQIYEYNCLCFGVSCAPMIFTKLLKPVVNFLRQSGFLSVVYLDDFLLLGNDDTECAANVSQTISLLEHLGFIINYDKSLLVPSHTCNYLGFLFNSIDLTISVPEEKSKDLIALMERSSLAQIAPDLSHDFRIHKFFKGVYMLRPAMPKYQNTWDPAVVLDYTRNLKNADISLNILSKKLITLLALATGQRLQTLASIDIDNIHRSDMKIDIPIPRRIKTSARNKFQPFLILPFLNSDPENCVASTLLYYLEKTKLLRGSIKNLFISITKPYKEISTQTLGRWVKNILEKSGVDTNKFSAHSTRHASTSAANRKGVNFDTIRLSAGWSKNSEMFAKVYNRPLVSDISFAEAVLSKT